MAATFTLSLLSAAGGATEIISSVLMLLAGLGVLMTGMRMLSEGLERSAGGSMRKLFGKISNNRFAGIGVGAVATVLVNSSAATTVMVIGFVNAGLMTLFQATSIIMGANIGTTLTGVIIALSGFDIGTYMAVLVFVGVIIGMFAKNDTVKRVGFALAGLGLIFVGLSFMSGALKDSPILTNALQTLFTWKAVQFPLLLILIGIVCTALFQSSTAMTALVVTMVGTIIPMESALFIILGTNIGTCVTAIIASFGASTNAKRTAMIHLLFNTIGTVVFTTFIWIFRGPVVTLFNFIAPNSPQMQVALFHVFFNVITTAFLVPFIRPLTRLATLLVKEKKNDDDMLKMYYIDDRILHTPPIAVAQVLKEVVNMSEMARDNLDRGMKCVLERTLSERDKVLKEEEKINFVNKGVARYLIKMQSLSLSKSDEKLVGSLHHVISDVERIGDHAENFTEEAQEMTESDIKFTQDAVDELTAMYTKVRKMFDTAIYVFENRDTTQLKDVSKMEAEIDVMKRELGNNHVARLNAGACSVDCSTHFYSLITALERVADHLTNIAFSIRSTSGSQVEAMAKLAEENAKKRGLG